MANKGYFLLFNQILDNPLLDDKPYCKGYAWVCLLAMTQRKRNMMKVKNGCLIPVERGECGRSEVYLADKFGWSRDKLRRWLKELKKNAMIQQKIVENHSIIKVLNFEKWQSNTTKKEQSIQQNNSENTSVLDQKIEQIIQQTIQQNFKKIIQQNNSENTSVLDQKIEQIIQQKIKENKHNRLNSNISYINISLSIEERENLKKYIHEKKKNVKDADAYIRKLIDNGDISIILDKAKKWQEGKEKKAEKEKQVQSDGTESEEKTQEAFRKARERVEKIKKGMKK